MSFICKHSEMDDMMARVAKSGNKTLVNDLIGEITQNIEIFGEYTHVTDTKPIPAELRLSFQILLFLLCFLGFVCLCVSYVCVFVVN